MTTDDMMPRVDLSYEHPWAPQMSTDQLLGRARAVRRRRRVRLLVAGVVVMACLGGALAWSQTLGERTTPLGDRSGPNLRSHITDAAEPPTVLSDPASPAWRSKIRGEAVTAFAYLNTDRQVCVGHLVADSFTAVCIASAADARGAPWVDLPAFQPVRNQDGSVLVIGLAYGPAAKVNMTFHGQRVTATTRQVPGVPGMEAYAAWLPTDGAQSYGTADLTQLVARDSSGQQIAVGPPG